MYDLKTAPVSLQRSRGQGIPEGTPDIGKPTALRRHARRIIAARYFHEMQRTQWQDRRVILV